jgi:hypothetical protein
MATPTARELLEKAIERRSELARELTALDSLISMYRGLLSRSLIESAMSLDQPDLYRNLPPRAVHAAQISEMMDAARRMMIAEKRPMKRGELVRRLQDEGFTIVGKDKNKVFGTNLWRSGRFRMVENKGYWPKDVTLPKEASTGDTS